MSSSKQLQSKQETIESIKNGIKGCLQVYEIQKEALKKKYGISEDAGEELKVEDTPVQPAPQEQPAERLQRDGVRGASGAAQIA